MSHTSEPLSKDHRELRDTTAEQTQPSDDIASKVSEVASLTKGAEVLRYVFTRTTRPIPPSTSKNSSRVAKSTYHRTTLPSIRQSKPRDAFHKVFTSIFSNNSTRTVPLDLATRRRRTDSGALGKHPKPASPLHDSAPSLEVVSPGTFLFSGPSLRSTCSGSFSNSTSQLPSLTRNGGESQPIRRVRSDSFSIDSMSLWEDGIVGPTLEGGIIRNFSDGLPDLDTHDEFKRPVLKDLAEDEDLPQASVGEDRPLPNFMTVQIAQLLLPYVEFASWKGMRLVCRSWHASLQIVAPAKLPSSYSLPNEILQHIYAYLGPKDFNAARHTCRTWMHASLERNLLAAMLKRGGWWSAAEHNLDKRNNTHSHFNTVMANKEWFLSRFLSRECALSANWKGNGLQHGANCSVFRKTSETDFDDLATGDAGPGRKHSKGIVFSTSICGRFLLAAEAELIYVYELQGSNLRPLALATCPRRVLTMSMDVSSGRLAIAALLEGRKGFVSEDLTGGDNVMDHASDVFATSRGCPFRTSATQTAVTTSRTEKYDTNSDVARRTFRGHRSSQYSNDGRHSSAFNTVDVQSNGQAINLQRTNDPGTYDQNWINYTWNLNLRAPPTSMERKINARPGLRTIFPYRTGTGTIYRHLCSEDDPPRSVSICPQRRCVAFGCSAGIELHWIDAMTGQSLSRWFPLTAPSDFLYFLPPRPGFDSSKKLRLISSAAHPSERPNITRKFYSSRPTPSAIWGSLGFDTHASTTAPGPNCDHYHARPLSDGHHVLFVDPPTGKLFLGCDAPLGGPTKLLRKIVLLPPEDFHHPRLYTAAADLTAGARIAVVYGDTIVLYSVPPDVFTLSKLEQKAESWDVYTVPPFTNKGRPEDHWLNWWDEPYPPYLPNRSPIWPLALRGTIIGTLVDVCDLAIFTDPEITIWGFALNAKSKTWQVRSESSPAKIPRRMITRSGRVYNSLSTDEIPEAHASGPSTPVMDAPGNMDVERPVSFDGNSSQTFSKRLSRALHVESDEWVDQLDVRGCEAWYDTDGDIMFYNADDGIPVGWDDVDARGERNVGAYAGW